MPDEEQTLGQKRVGAKFNPSNNEKVDQIKNKAAELIDLIESIGDGKEMNGELRRAMSTAQTKIETGTMYAVKANFL